MILDYTSVGLDLIGIIFALGAGFYFYQTASALEGDALQRGMYVLATTPFLIALSAILDLLSELGILQVWDAVHYFTRIIFILVLFVGARTIVRAWKKID